MTIEIITTKYDGEGIDYWPASLPAWKTVRANDTIVPLTKNQAVRMMLSKAAKAGK